MEISNSHRIKSILNRYKLAYRTFNEDDIEIGGGLNIKHLKLYYFYLPLVIGSIIVFIGLQIDFTLLTFCGAPFLLYSVYGIGQINLTLKKNRNTTIIKSGEIRISRNNVVSVLNSQNIKNYEIKTECLDDEYHLSQFFIIDNQNNENLLLALIDDKLPLLTENMQLLNDFTQAKINATNTP